MNKIKARIHKSLRIFGLDLVRYRPSDQAYPPDFAPEEIEIIRAVRPWTMTTPERIFALVHATRYVSLNRIPGAIVECGVWKGGSMAAIAKTLLQLHDMSRDLYLFDTFQGMTKPTPKDVEYTGKHATQVLEEEVDSRCADAPLEEFRMSCTRQVIPREKYTSCVAG